MLSPIGAQQADIFTPCLHYDWICSNLRCKDTENIPSPLTPSQQQPPLIPNTPHSQPMTPIIRIPRHHV
jgi:hypothetical protein